MFKNSYLCVVIVWHYYRIFVAPIQHLCGTIAASLWLGGMMVDSHRTFTTHFQLHTKLTPANLSISRGYSGLFGAIFLFKVKSISLIHRRRTWCSGLRSHACALTPTKSTEREASLCHFGSCDSLLAHSLWISLLTPECFYFTPWSHVLCLYNTKELQWLKYCKTYHLRLSLAFRMWFIPI